MHILIITLKSSFQIKSRVRESLLSRSEKSFAIIYNLFKNWVNEYENEESWVSVFKMNIRELSILKCKHFYI